MDDTTPEAWATMIDLYRRMTPAQRVARMAALNRMVQELAAARIRREHPDASPREIQLRVAALWLGREAMLRTYGWAP